MAIFIFGIATFVWATKKWYRFEGPRTAQLVSYSYTDFGWRLCLSVYRPEKSQSMTYFALYNGNDSTVLKYFKKKSHKDIELVPAVTVTVECKEGPLCLNCVTLK